LRQGAFAEEGGRQQPFTFVPSLSGLERIQTVEGPGLGLVETVEPGVTPVPTIGPGQYYEEGEEDLLPEVTRPDLLDYAFGYSEISGHPGLFLVWSTDDAGSRRYYVISVDNPYFDDIVAVTDANHDAWADLGGEGVSGDMLHVRVHLGFAGAFGFAIPMTFCGVGAFVSALATPVSIPLTAAFTGCAGFFSGATGASTMFAYYAQERLDSFDARNELDRMAVEGFFQQLPYVTDQ
jgi:hypothetical protein